MSNRHSSKDKSYSSTSHRHPAKHLGPTYGRAPSPTDPVENTVPTSAEPDLDGSDIPDEILTGKSETERKKTKHLVVFTTVILVIGLILAGGIAGYKYFFKGVDAASKAQPVAPDPYASGVSLAWSRTVSFADTGEGFTRAHAAYDSKGGVVSLFVMNGQQWQVKSFDSVTGESLDTLPELPACNADLPRPFTYASGKLTCVSTDPHASPLGANYYGNLAINPPDGDAGNAGGSNQKMKQVQSTSSVMIYQSKNLDLEVSPSALAATEIAAFRGQDELWRQTLKNEGVINANDSAVWTVSAVPDKTGSFTLDFYLVGGPKNAARDAGKPQDYLLQADFATMIMPDAVATLADGTKCFNYWNAASKPLEVMPDKPGKCLTKLEHGISQASDGPDDEHLYNHHTVIRTYDPDYQYTTDDFNGDGYTDVLLQGQSGNQIGYYLVITNPRDINHPYVGFFYATKSSKPEYEGDSVWKVADPAHPDKTVEYSVQMVDGKPTIIRGK